VECGNPKHAMVKTMIVFEFSTVPYRKVPVNIEYKCDKNPEMEKASMTGA
jgi:hypothetical protein